MTNRPAPEVYAVILVYSTGHALHLEKLLKACGVPSKLIPVPRHLSSSCGSCLLIERAYIDMAQEVISDSGVEIEGLHLI